MLEGFISILCSSVLNLLFSHPLRIKRRRADDYVFSSNNMPSTPHTHHPILHTHTPSSHPPAMTDRGRKEGLEGREAEGKKGGARKIENRGVRCAPPPPTSNSSSSNEGGRISIWILGRYSKAPFTSTHTHTILLYTVFVFVLIVVFITCLITTPHPAGSFCSDSVSA